VRQPERVRTADRADTGDRNPGNKKKKRSRNREFAAVTYFTIALFIIMMGYIGYYDLYRSQDFINSPYNERQDVYANKVTRGEILASDGEVLAKTVTADDGTETREYPFGSVFAHVVGYDTNGKAGLESEENFSLLTSDSFFLEKIQNDLQDKKNTGDNVVTTLDVSLQQAAYDALGDNKGAVVVMEPSTGKILAMVSKPDYDPNTLSDNWSELNSDTDNTPMLNRATKGLYPPGSVFKILTALEFMREDSNYSDYAYNCTGSITQGETTIQCFDGTAHGEEDLTLSFAHSCNSSFANIGLSLNGDSFLSTCESLLFNKDLPCPLGSSQSQFKENGSSGYAVKMMTAMGQGETLVSPYHMALITSAVANGGTLMTPYLVDKVQNYAGSVVTQTDPSVYKKLMTSQEASALTQLMSAVVSEGTAVELSYGDYTVAGKTGTAEYSSDKTKSHSWFTGFSNVDNPDIAVTVIVEGYDGNRNARAIPIAKSVFDAYHMNR